MIKPTIGRQVWFKPNPVNVPELTHAATVVCVHSDTLVNLAVLDGYGELYQRRSVTLVQPGEAEPAAPFCHWMPYQVTAAKPAPAINDAGLFALTPTPIGAGLFAGVAALSPTFATEEQAITAADVGSATDLVAGQTDTQ